jgi:hypothetical protein
MASRRLDSRATLAGAMGSPAARRQEEPILPSEPLADDPFREIDELAARRRAEIPHR